MIQTLYSVQYITRFSSIVMVQNLTFDRIKDSAVFIQDQAMHIPARVGLLLLRQPSLVNALRFTASVKLRAPRPFQWEFLNCSDVPYVLYFVRSNLGPKASMYCCIMYS